VTLFVDQSGQIGGAELCLADLAAGRPNSRVLLFSDGPFASLLKGRSIPVELLPLPVTAARVTKSASLINLTASLPSLLLYVEKLARRMKRVDVVYLNTAKALVYGAAANLLSRRPAVFHLHDLLDASHFSKANLRVLLTAANRMDLVIANSRSVADAFRSQGGRTRTEVIPNGFDPQAFTGIAETEIAALHSQWNPKQQPVITIFGRLTRWKGQHVLLQAAERVPGTTIWIVGEALFTDDDRAYAEELRKLAHPLGSRVHFLGFRKDIPALMAASDIVAHCSTAPEPFGRVLVEAMLAGKPVVASDAGGPREIVVPGETGLLIPPGNPERLAAALGELIASSDLRHSMGRAGRDRAIQLFSLAIVQQQTSALLDELTR